MTDRRAFNRAVLAVLAAPLAARAQRAAAPDSPHRALYLYQGADREAKIAAEAKREGQVVMYTSLNLKDSVPLTEVFEKRTGVKVSLWRASSEKVLQRAVTEARANLKNPPRIYTEVAIEQMPGNISFFENDVPLAFKAVTDPKLLADFRAANNAVIASLKEYEQWMKKDLLPRSQGITVSGRWPTPSASVASSSPSMTITAKWTRGISSPSASSHACNAPAPPNATSV